MTQQEWSRLLKAYHTARVASDAAKTLSNQIKSGLAEEGRTEVAAGGFIARTTRVQSVRLDSKRLKEEEPALYEKYSVAVETERLYFK